MGTEGARAGAERARRQWEGLARRDPVRSIVGHDETGSPAEFLRGGHEIAGPVIEYLDGRHRGGRMLEVGCGMGRTVQAFAPCFELVEGVDISPTMIKWAQRLQPPANVRFSTTSGTDLSAFADGTFDFVFSFITLQHVADGSVISAMIREVARVMAPGALAILQFDTRESTLKSRAVFALPDLLLPHLHRRGMRRVRRHRGWLTDQFIAAGLWVVDERDRWMTELRPGGTSAFHHFVLSAERPGSSDRAA